MKGASQDAHRISQPLTKDREGIAEMSVFFRMPHGIRGGYSVRNA